MIDRAIYRRWLGMPSWLRKPVSQLSEKVFPLLFFAGKRVAFESVTFRVGINNLGDLRRALEFPYKEGAFTQAVYESAQRHRVIYDVGAHVGYYVLLVARCNPEATVIAFEPEENNLRALKRHILRNRVNNVIVNRFALGEVNSELFFEKENISGRAGGGTHRLTSSGQGEHVESIRLDERLNEKTWPVPSMIIMDIEGGELAALRGMEETLRRYSPELFLEVHSDLLQRRMESEKMLDDYLEKFGYIKTVLRRPLGRGIEHKQIHVRYHCPAMPTRD